MYDCIVDNDGAHQTAIVMDQDCMLFLHGTIVRRGYDGIYAKKSTVYLSHSMVNNNT